MRWRKVGTCCSGPSRTPGVCPWRRIGRMLPLCCWRSFSDLSLGRLDCWVGVPPTFSRHRFWPLKHCHHATARVLLTRGFWPSSWWNSRGGLLTDDARHLNWSLCLGILAMCLPHDVCLIRSWSRGSSTPLLLESSSRRRTESSSYSLLRECGHAHRLGCSLRCHFDRQILR